MVSFPFFWGLLYFVVYIDCAKVAFANYFMKCWNIGMASSLWILFALHALLKSCRNERIDMGFDCLNTAEFIFTYLPFAHFATFSKDGSYLPGLS